MKLDIGKTGNDIEIIGDEPMKSNVIGIREKNMPHLISMLTKIYSDPEGSIVREITSNCFDAHVKAGVVGEPVIIRRYIDATGQNFIEFVDKGCGISPDLMDSVYMSLLESDKRDSNDFIGAFGLGSKTPFSYSTYFYLITKVDGVSYTYLMSEGQDGFAYDLVNTEILEKSSGNGTIVRVPIKKSDISVFESKIKSQLKYFNDVYVIGFDVENEYEIKEFNTFKIRVDSFLEKMDSELHISLGKVNYPINWSALEMAPIPFNVALKFDIGDLDVVENREAIKYTERTKKKIIEKFNSFYNEINDIIDSNLIAKDILDAFTKQASLNSCRIKLNLSDSLEVKVHEFHLPFISFKNKSVSYTIDNQKFNIGCGLPYLIINNVNLFLTRDCDGMYARGVNRIAGSFTALTHPLFRDNSSVKNCISIRKKISKSEREYLYDYGFHSLFTYSNNRLAIEIASHLLKENKVSSDGSYNYVRNLIEKIKGRLNTELFKNNCYHLDDLKIPKNYASNNKPIKKKVEGEVLLYWVDILTASTRELFKGDSLDRLLNNKNNIYIYGNSDDAATLKTLNKLLRGTELYNKATTFHCAKKYWKVFAGRKNFINLNDIDINNENYKLVIDIIKQQYGKFTVSIDKTKHPFIEMRQFITRFSYKQGSFYTNKLISVFNEKRLEIDGYLDSLWGLSRIISEKDFDEFLNIMGISVFDKDILTMQSKVAAELINIERFLKSFSLEFLLFNNSLNTKFRHSLLKNLKIKKRIINNFKLKNV